MGLKGPQGYLRLLGVVPKDVKNDPSAKKSIFFKMQFKKLVMKHLNGYRVISWRNPMLMGLRGPKGSP